MIEKECKQNMYLDHQIETMRMDIDEKRFTKNYLIHEKELIARNERY